MISFRTTISLILLVVAIALASFWFTLSQVNLSTASISSISDISRSGATVNATLAFTNDGLFAVEIEKLTYTATLSGVEEPLAQGESAGALLRTDRPTSVQVSFPINWEPTAQLAARALAGKNTTITVEGTATIGAGPFSRTVPYSIQVDGKEYLEQFIPKSTEELIGAVLGLLG